MLREFARRDRRVRGVPVRGLTRPGLTRRGFTLIELLAALLVLSLLALMSYRSLGAVLDAREHVREESAKWRRIEAFYARFKQDVQLAAPRPVRTPGGSAPAWLGSSDSAGPHLAFSRFASSEGVDLPRRVGYGRNDRQEVELTVWPGLDLAPDAQPARYAVLGGVSGFELQYLNANLVWVDAWPAAPTDAPLPLAVRLRIVLASGEDMVRIFALDP
jgi:general secretion pathway protein J